jgi:hypothetical protein
MTSAFSTHLVPRLWTRASVQDVSNWEHLRWVSYRQAHPKVPQRVISHMRPVDVSRFQRVLFSILRQCVRVCESPLEHVKIHAKGSCKSIGLLLEHVFKYWKCIRSRLMYFYLYSGV